MAHLRWQTGSVTQMVTERLRKGDNNFVTFCIGNTNTKAYVLDPLLRFPFSGPVNDIGETRACSTRTPPPPEEQTCELALVGLCMFIYIYIYRYIKLSYILYNYWINIGFD